MVSNLASNNPVVNISANNRRTKTTQKGNNKKGTDSKLLDSSHVSLLKKQQYYFLGNHSAVKVCEWTKKSLRDNGTCYKEKFYGIRAHMCCQISVSVSFCQNRCVFCWRDLAQTKGDSFDNIDKELIDDPITIATNSVIGQQKLLEGFAGFKGTDMTKFEQSKEPMHYAISLTGEGTLYPYLAEFITELHSKGKTTFLVTNGIYPEALEKLNEKNALPTQLYISVDAPNEELQKKIDRSTVKDSWKKFLKSMSLLKEFKNKTRTTLRITTIKDMNMCDLEGYKSLLDISNPTFIEVKSYMWVGGSRERLDIKNMPTHLETRDFAQKICNITDYKIIDEKKNSRVVLLMKEDFDERIMKFD